MAGPTWLDKIKYRGISLGGIKRQIQVELRRSASNSSDAFPELRIYFAQVWVGITENIVTVFVIDPQAARFESICTRILACAASKASETGMPVKADRMGTRWTLISGMYLPVVAPAHAKVGAMRICCGHRSLGAPVRRGGPWKKTPRCFRLEL